MFHNSTSSCEPDADMLLARFYFSQIWSYYCTSHMIHFCIHVMFKYYIVTHYNTKEKQHLPADLPSHQIQCHEHGS